MLPQLRCAVFLFVVFLVELAWGQVSGVVTDKKTGLPIKDARVSVQASSISAISDVNGAFFLAAASGAGLVIVGAKKGFYNQGVKVDAPKTGVAIELDAVDMTVDPKAPLVAPESCATCHHEQYDQWINSPMKHSGENTWVYDIYDGTGTPGGQRWIRLHSG